MFNLKEKLEFMDDGIDFPFYNDIPKLSRGEWFLVFLSIVAAIYIIMISEIPDEYFSLSLFVVTVIPALYICKGKFSLFFRKPKWKGAKMALLCLAAYYIYSYAIIAILELIGHGTVIHADSATFASPDLFFCVTTIIQLLQEEFFKVLILLLIMYLVYRYTGKRNWALGTGLFVALLTFGLVHYYAYEGNILQIVFLQGFGSLCYFYPYLKTKSVVIPYILHLTIDFLPVVLMLIANLLGIPVPA